MGLLLAFEYLSQRHFRWRALRPDVLALGLVPLGLGIYVVYLYQRFGDPLIYFQVQEAWGRRMVPPWETFRDFFSQPLRVHSPDHSMVDLGFTLFFAVVAVAAWRVVPVSYALFVTTFLLMILASGRLGSLMRFGATFFPVFIVLAIAGRSSAFDRSYLVLATMLSALFMVMFALWYWVA